MKKPMVAESEAGEWQEMVRKWVDFSDNESEAGSDEPGEDCWKSWYWPGEGDGEAIEDESTNEEYFCSC